MGDVLPPKRQTGVERLKRRFELYRRHQNACLPRYEQAENGLYEIQRQETLLLKQRYLESKAKKAKSNKSEHHRSYKESVADSCKTQVHTKPLKRPAEESLQSQSIECSNKEDGEKPSKLLRSDISSDKLSELQTQQQSTQQSQPSLPNFSVQIVQQFNNKPHSQQSQTNVTVQALNKPLSSPISQSSSNKSSQEPVVNVAESQQVKTQLLATIECKQEKDSNQTDFCQFKNAQNTTSDRLSDTFPSLGFTDESGDDVIHPDLLKDLIDDVFTNPPDIQDFNFDDSVGSIKDQDDATKDIIDLIKESSPMRIRPFQTDNLPLVNNSVNQQSRQQQQPQQQQSQQNGLFKNMSATNEVPVSVIITTTTSNTNFYSTTAQRLPSYSNSSLNISSLDFKMNEPSPAALTLKQMAEQHQNMQKHQQQQLVNSALTGRSFNQDAFNPHINQLRSTSNFHTGTNPNLPSPKTPSSNHIFNTFDRQINTINNFTTNEPLNNLPISPNNIFDSRNSNVLSEIEHSKQSSCVPVQQQQIIQQQHQHLQQQDHHQQQLQQKQSSQQQQPPPPPPQQQQKPPAYPSSRQLPHFSENSQLKLQNPVSNQHQSRPIGRQFSNSMQIVQTQIHSNQGHLGVQQMPANPHNVNQQQHHMIPHSGQYTSFSSQQSMNNPAYHISMSQNMSYSPQFNSSNQTMNSLHHVNRPPPEYKAHQSIDNGNLIDQLKVSSSQVMFNHSASKDNLLNKHQRPPNVTIAADGSVIRASSAVDWRHIINEQQNRGNSTFRSNYNNNNFGRNEHPVQQSQIFNQYRMQDNQMTSNRMIRPNMISTQMLLQQRPRVSIPQRPRNQSPLEQHSSIGITSNGALPTLSSNFNNRHDINRGDGMLNLDFLDNIESSASDLLNFDQVMQEGATNFPLLDDMEILGK